MSPFDDRAFENLIELCRISCSEMEKRELKEKLDEILVYVNKLNEVEVGEVLPCNNALSGLSNVMREDIEGEKLDREIFLENSPSHVGGMIRVPPIMKQEA